MFWYPNPATEAPKLLSPQNQSPGPSHPLWSVPTSSLINSPPGLPHEGPPQLIPLRARTVIIRSRARLRASLQETPRRPGGSEKAARPSWQHKKLKKKKKIRIYIWWITKKRRKASKTKQNCTICVTSTNPEKTCLLSYWFAIQKCNHFLLPDLFQKLT